jgi:hypothetical protein
MFTAGTDTPFPKPTTRAFIGNPFIPDTIAFEHVTVSPSAETEPPPEPSQAANAVESHTNPEPPAVNVNVTSPAV